MTKLEEEIFRALGDALDTLDDDCNGEYIVYAKAAAEVAKKYIERALQNYKERLTEVLYVKGDLGQSDLDICKEYTAYWLKENGITE